jgi:hypothetical protein
MMYYLGDKHRNMILTNLPPSASERFLRRSLLSIALLGLAWVVTLSSLGAPVSLVEQLPVQITNLSPGVILVDFGRAAFGNLQLMPPADAAGKLTVRFGEALAQGQINRNPPGSVRYAEVETVLQGGDPLIVAPAPDRTNTRQPPAVATSADWGVVLPFRWVEIEGWPGLLRPEQIRRRAAFASNWDDNAATFHSSDETLNRIWELCHYSVKATTFAGVYVDGDRERVAYEADAYLAQIGRYYADGDVQMARDTFDRLLMHPTWPTEWAPHMIFMAYADWMQTGDTNWLAAHYGALKSKLQFDRVRADGLLISNEAQVKHDDLVDWPPGERDGYVFTPANTVVNAFHLHALDLMSKLALALNRDAEAADYSRREKAACSMFQKRFFDTGRRLYRDAENNSHTSLHANLFPLAFGLVPVEERAHVAGWLSDRGMVCSVYAAQYLLEGLFENDCDSQALSLITAPTDRSWKHMVDSGTTITWEAWDQRFKPNQDWSHVWGAAPANLFPRFILGAQPLAPGWRRVLIRPTSGPLKSAEGKIPTPQGPILISWEHGKMFKLSLSLPVGVGAQLQLPACENLEGVLVNGKAVSAQRNNKRLIVDESVYGSAIIEEKSSELGLR